MLRYSILAIVLNLGLLLPTVVILCFLSHLDISVCSRDQNGQIERISGTSLTPWKRAVADDIRRYGLKQPGATQHTILLDRYRQQFSLDHYLYILGSCLLCSDVLLLALDLIGCCLLGGVDRFLRFPLTWTLAGLGLVVLTPVVFCGLRLRRQANELLPHTFMMDSILKFLIEQEGDLEQIGSDLGMMNAVRVMLSDEEVAALVQPFSLRHTPASAETGRTVLLRLAELLDGKQINNASWMFQFKRETWDIYRRIIDLARQEK